MLDVLCWPSNVLFSDTGLSLFSLTFDIQIRALVRRHCVCFTVFGTERACSTVWNLSWEEQTRCQLLGPDQTATGMNIVMDTCACSTEADMSGIEPTVQQQHFQSGFACHKNLMVLSHEAYLS